VVDAGLMRWLIKAQGTKAESFFPEQRICSGCNCDSGRQHEAESGPLVAGTQGQM